MKMLYRVMIALLQQKINISAPANLWKKVCTGPRRLCGKILPGAPHFGKAVVQ